MKETNHISVCICTYKRPRMLSKLISKLQEQVTDNQFTYSAVIVDNDANQSANNIVKNWQEKSLIQIDYHWEPEQNIALARNKAVENAKGNFIAFIDDDEFPIDTWLISLYNTLKIYGVDGAFGPVIPHFPKDRPNWIVKSKVCDRPSFKTGTPLLTRDTRTGNVLLKSRMFTNEKNRFEPQFGKIGGEDVRFFDKMIKNGYRFIWSNESIVYEWVSENRLKRLYYWRRFFRFGNVAGEQRFYTKNVLIIIQTIINSLLSLIFYFCFLPIFFFCSHFIFMKSTNKLSYHIGRILGLIGFYIMREKKD